jgi:phage shock protein A
VPATPTADALRQQLADARERIRQLEASETQLKAKITTLRAVITELTHEAKAGNIVAILARREPP